MILLNLCFCRKQIFVVSVIVKKNLPAQTRMPHTSEHLGNLAKGIIFLGITGFDSQTHHVQLLSSHTATV